MAGDRRSRAPAGPDACRPVRARLSDYQSAAGASKAHAMLTEVLPFSSETIAQAARLIVAGAPVAVPTETVYGLAADARSGEAVAAIYAAKGRPSFNPLIVHVPDVATARELADLSEAALRL